MAQNTEPQAGSSSFKPNEPIDDKHDFKITVLGEDNYTTWKWQVVMILKAKGLYDCVTGVETNEAKNRLAAILLGSALSQLNMQRVINCETAHEIWTALEASFENKSSTEKSMLMEKFTSFNIKSVREISKGIGEIQALAAKLRSLGAHIDEEFIVSILLKSLPDNLKNWKSTWMMVNAERPSLNNLITGVMAEVNNMKIPTDSALVAVDKPWNRKPSNKYKPNYQNKWTPRAGTSNGGGGQHQRDTCHYCKKIGHWARDCRKKQADEKNTGNPGSPQRGIAMMAI